MFEPVFDPAARFASPPTCELSPHAQFVRLAFETNASDCLTAPLSRTETTECLRAIGTRVSFDGDAIAEALEPLLGSFHFVQVGREAGPVVYVQLACTARESMGRPLQGIDRRISPKTRRAAATSFFVAMKELGATSLYATAHEDVPCDAISVSSTGISGLPDEPLRLVACWG